MVEAFEDVYLGWKSVTSEDRYIIGVISKHQDKLTFKYILDEVAKASRDGFKSYFDFQHIDRVYNQNVLEIFSQRLTPKSRFKTASVYRFWEISEQILQDRLATIAFTQAMLPTDSFEFLADFKPIKGLSFITDLLGTNSMHIPAKAIDNNDPLTWHHLSGNESLEGQVLVRHDEYRLGFVKKIHSNIFKKYKGSIRIKVHDVEKQETLKRVFIKIELL